jgi:hypothetical protein
MPYRTSTVFAWLANFTFIGALFADAATAYGLLILSGATALAALTLIVHND